MTSYGQRLREVSRPSALPANERLTMQRESSAERIVEIKMPGSIVFGPGACEGLSARMQSFPEGPVVIVTDAGLVKAGVVEKIQGLLSSAGREVQIFDSVEPDPDKKCVEQCLEVVRQAEAKVLLGIGGGSSLDVAKVSAVIQVNGGQISDYVGIGKVPGPGLPTILLPTTAGTGSEASPIAVISDKKQHSKLGIVSPHLYCELAIVDPALTLSCPVKVTASAGIDALTHAVEIYTNKFSVELIDTLVLEAIRLIGEHLSKCVRDGSDLTARTGMSLAALYGGMGLGPVNTAAVHALAYPLGGTFDVAHGLANSILLPYVMEFNEPVCQVKFARIAEALGFAGGDEKKKASRAVEMVRKLSKEVGIPERLRDIGIPEGAIGQMAQSAAKVTRLLNNNPREMTIDDVKQIYKNAY